MTILRLFLVLQLSLRRGTYLAHVRLLPLGTGFALILHEQRCFASLIRRPESLRRLRKRHGWLEGSLIEQGTLLADKNLLHLLFLALSPREGADT